MRIEPHERSAATAETDNGARRRQQRGGRRAGFRPPRTAACMERRFARGEDRPRLQVIWHPSHCCPFRLPTDPWSQRCAQNEQGWRWPTRAASVTTLGATTASPTSFARSATTLVPSVGRQWRAVLWCMGTVAPETVTVVFTDVVGSTAWRARVGDVVADVRTGELERASREVVTSSGGLVVKSLGDGVMATFSSAVAGLEAAAALQAVARRLRIGGEELCLRVGVSSGDMVREGDDWLGAAAIEASRLCAEADGGSVLVADATERLSRGRSDRVLRPAGGRVLRGFDVPIEVYELVADGEGDDSVAGGAGDGWRGAVGGARRRVGPGRFAACRRVSGVEDAVHRRRARGRQDTSCCSRRRGRHRSRVHGSPRTLRGRSGRAVSAGDRGLRAVVGGLPGCGVGAHGG